MVNSNQNQKEVKELEDVIKEEKQKEENLEEEDNHKMY